MVAGVIYNPIMDELYSAEKGRGAYLNDQRRLRVAARKDLSNAVVTTGIPHHGRTGHKRFLAEAEQVMKACSGVRRTGTAALDMAWVAAGRFDGYWEHGIKAWDMAAGVIIVREAGGFVSDTDGDSKMLEKGSVIAANPNIHKGLVSLLTSVDS
jgi:myo-inositol-1(or 4)-monophosphatase